MSRPKLLDQVHDTIRVKHYSMRTEEAYVLQKLPSNSFCKHLVIGKISSRAFCLPEMSVHNYIFRRDMTPVLEISY